MTRLQLDISYYISTLADAYSKNWAGKEVAEDNRSNSPSLVANRHPFKDCTSRLFISFALPPFLGATRSRRLGALLWRQVAAEVRWPGRSFGPVLKIQQPP